MWNWLRRLFGSTEAAASARPGDDYRSDYSGSFHRPVVTRYYELLEVISNAKADKDYPKAIRAARDTYAILGSFVRESMREDGGVFVIGIIPAIDVVAPMMAVMGDRDAIEEMSAAIAGVGGLEQWFAAGERALQEADLVDRILASVVKNPGLKQSKLKGATGASDGRRLSTLARWLEDAGRLVRVRVGSTYELHPEGTIFSRPETVASLEKGAESAQGTLMVEKEIARRRAEKPKIIDLSSLPYVRLPRAPAGWEERDVQQKSDSPVPKEELPLFAVEGADWHVDDPQTLEKSERPDPAFKRMFLTAGHTYALDPRGRSKGYEDSVSILRVADRTGAAKEERGLPYDVYRADVNVDGSGIIFLSREAILHAYDHTLASLLSVQIGDVPEHQAASERLGIPERQKKNHIRCVALSNNTRSYLFTVVDEAWCMRRNGEPAWGLRMPTPEEWTRCSTRTEKCGTSAEISQALKLMGLELPVTPDEVTLGYKRAAMETHPDRNSAPDAVERMQDLNAAMNLLTGTDLSDLSLAATETVSYEKILSRTSVDLDSGHVVSVEITMVVSEAAAADWIYAADFAARDDSAYIAGYSGRVIAIAADGTPKRVYDIGAVPRQIIDVGEHLYFLTDTRLYVLSGDRLEALVDVFEKGELLVGETGFALLESKSLTWFSPSGLAEGTVKTRDPIRRVFSTPEGVAIETRRHRALVRGAPPWWSADAVVEG